MTEKGEERKRRGFCFVTFENEDIADAACKENFHVLEGAEVHVHVHVIYYGYVDKYYMYVTV